MNKKRILWITQTAIFIALLVSLQAVTRPLGQFVTGSVVNLILIIAVMTGGLWSGVATGAISPVFAFLFGIGPAFFPVIPFIMVGNVILVVLWYLIGRLNIKGWLIPYVIALVAGAGAKFLWLYLGVVQVAVPVFGFPAPMVAVFGVTQLITAGIGGAVAIVILPMLRKALKFTEHS